MKKYSMETAVGIFVALGLLCVGYMTAKLGKVQVFGDDSYSLYAKFTTVSGLRAKSPVEMHGLQIGRVERLTMDQKEQMAVVELKIMKGVQVFDDAIASIRTAGLIGDKYVKIAPGGAGRTLTPGEIIRETEAPADIMELIGKYAFGDVSK